MWLLVTSAATMTAAIATARMDVAAVASTVPTAAAAIDPAIVMIPRAAAVNAHADPDVGTDATGPRRQQTGEKK
jgi:hypothetical protein